MLFIRSVLHRIHIFCLGFAISAGCLLTAGMIANYDENHVASADAMERWQIKP
ncbi:MAG: hypothetical protein AAGA08_06760 [Pseudomonadota bacterium]